MSFQKGQSGNPAGGPNFKKGQPSANPEGRKRNRYPERIEWEEVMRKLGVDREGLARALGVCQRTVACWERGEKNYRGAAKRPPPPVMKLVAKLLEIHALKSELDALFSGINVTDGGKDDLSLPSDGSDPDSAAGAAGGHAVAPQRTADDAGD